MDTGVATATRNTERETSRDTNNSSAGVQSSWIHTRCLFICSALSNSHRPPATAREPGTGRSVHPLYRLTDFHFSAVAHQELNVGYVPSRVTSPQGHFQFSSALQAEILPHKTSSYFSRLICTCCCYLHLSSEHRIMCGSF